MDSAPYIPSESKTGLSRATLAEPFLTSLYRSPAPYRGCGHGCRYCDGRAEKYYVEGDFERDISARLNLPALVARDVEEGFASREFGAVCIGSGVTDIYQPLEKSLELTRRTLESLVSANLPVVILTKNALALRDFDILSRFPKVLLIVTVTTVNETHASLLEPGASPPSERLEVVRRAKEAGFHSGVMAMPMCPGISDSAESFGALVDRAEKAGADFVYPGGLTLRPGRQKDLFIDLGSASFPELRPLYDDLYRENRQSGMPLVERYAPLAREWDTTLRARGIPQMIPHSVYRELLSPVDSIFVLLCHMETLYGIRGVDTRPLHAATGRYADWLKTERTALRRKRIKAVPSDPFPVTRILEEKLAELVGPGQHIGLNELEGIAHAPDGSDNAIDGLVRVLGNEKLARLAASLYPAGKNEAGTFDYPTLSAVFS